MYVYIYILCAFMIVKLPKFPFNFGPSVWEVSG